MDTTIRNLDDSAYRALKSRAALEGKTIGQALNEAIRAYLARSAPPPKRRSLRELVPQEYAEGTEQLSAEIDRVVYGDDHP